MIENGQVLTAEDFLPTSVNLVAMAGTFVASPQAVRGSDGFVDLVGSFTTAAGTNPVTGAIGYNTATIICILPVGFRPDRQTEGVSNPYGSIAQITAGVRIGTDGAVEVFLNNAGSGSTGGRFSLNGIRFRAAA